MTTHSGRPTNCCVNGLYYIAAPRSGFYKSHHVQRLLWCQCCRSPWLTDDPFSAVTPVKRPRYITSQGLCASRRRGCHHASQGQSCPDVVRIFVPSRLTPSLVLACCISPDIIAEMSNPSSKPAKRCMLSPQTGERCNTNVRSYISTAETD